MTDGVRPKASSVEGAAATVPDSARQRELIDNESTTTTANEERNSAGEQEEKSSTVDHEEGRQKEELPAEAPVVVGAVGNVGGSEQKAEIAAAGVEPDPHTEKTLSVTEQPSDEIQEHYAPKDEKEAETSAGRVEEEDEDDDTGIDYPSGTQLVLLTFGLCMAVFVVALDNTIIATAIPKITTDFNSLGDVGWYGSSYLLTTTALQPSFGRIFTYFNIKYTYIFALALFEVGSILCAAAKDSTMLILGRAIAGAGASAIFSGGMTIVGISVPLRKRSLYIATLSSMFGISSVVGPLLGGVFTDKATWRWCFWINLPFGAIAIGAVAAFFHPPPRKSTGLNWRQKILQIDLVGAFFLICAITCLLLALQWGGFTYAWTNSKVWGCLIGFSLLIAIFIAQQFRRQERATIPPRIFFQRTVLFSCLYSMIMNMAIYTHLFYLPFYFQAVKGTSAVDSGIRTIPYLISVIVASIIVGGTITVIGTYKIFMIIGASLFTVGCGMVYTLGVDSSAGYWIGYQLICGFGAGSGVQIPFIAIQVALSKKDIASGNALAIFFNSLGGALAISVAQNVFVNGLVNKIPEFAPDVNPFVVINAGATHIREVVSDADLPGVLLAYMKSLNESWILPIAAGAFSVGLAFFVENRSVKGKKLEPGAA